MAGAGVSVTVGARRPLSFRQVGGSAGGCSARAPAWRMRQHGGVIFLSCGPEKQRQRTRTCRGFGVEVPVATVARQAAGIAAACLRDME